MEIYDQIRALKKSKCLMAKAEYDPNNNLVQGDFYVFGDGMSALEKIGGLGSFIGQAHSCRDVVRRRVSQYDDIFG